MIKTKLEELVGSAYKKASAEGAVGSSKDFPECPEPIVIETPKLEEHGDLACGVALKLARHLKAPPIKIAEVLSQYIEKEMTESENKSENPNGGALPFSQEVANPGFINFKLGKSWLCEALKEVNAKGDDFGKPEKIEKKKINIEYVSANPTGDLHIGHGRGAVLGSCLANLFKFAGHDVVEEFLINDAGEQIAKLADCAWALYQKKLGKETPYPEEGYPEDSLDSYLDALIKEHGDKFLALDPQEGRARVGDLIKEAIRSYHEDLLARLGVTFDIWFSELTLHEKKKVEEAMEKLAASDNIYEKDGAVFLKAEALGDIRDRVLKKSTGRYTYLAGDAAYHLDKFQRGYDLMINIWGADHHGQVPGLKATIEALGEDPEKLQVVLTQIVNLNRDGEIVRMSKRRGTVVTLEEVMDEVGVDAVRYYLAESNQNNPINFDLELAKQSSKENPAFYIQYAHARCCSILRKALESYKDTESGKEEPAPLTEEQLEQFMKLYKEDASVYEAAFDDDAEVFNHQKKLVLKLQAFPQEVEDAVNAWQPGKLARYAYDLANDLQKFYEVSRVITSDLSVTRARLGLIMATRQVLQNVLKIIGVSAPERM